MRAAVLGANDGIVSTASLIVGVAAASADRGDILLAGVAGLIAGAMSMAAGEYVSVSSQSDAERAEIAIEQRELRDDPQSELEELAGIYVKRGVDPTLARQVAEQLTRKDALAAHARDELGITETGAARPVEAALASAASFAAGAALPLVAALLASQDVVVWVVSATAVAALALSGALGARAGGAPPLHAAFRVTLWGALAMAATAAAGALFGAAV